MQTHFQIFPTPFSCEIRLARRVQVHGPPNRKQCFDRPSGFVLRLFRSINLRTLTEWTNLIDPDSRQLLAHQLQLGNRSGKKKPLRAAAARPRDSKPVDTNGEREQNENGKEKEPPVFHEIKRQFEEASSRYAAEHAITRDADWYILKLQEEMGELTQAWNKASGRGRPRGASLEELRRSLADETADLLGHVLLFALHNDLDLAAAIERKWKFTPAL
jgi:NTP pyrophosphatase (non-canonical NTP hydrolase)